MSYNQQGGYYQPHQQYQAPPHTPQDPYSQNGQQQQGHNQSQPGQYGQVQYPGQQQYGRHQNGGPVQQLQPGQNDAAWAARSTSLTSTYPGQQQYQQQQQQQQQQQPAHPTYNPAHYAAHDQRQNLPTYNPAAYANTSPQVNTYNPAAYPDPSLHSTSGPLTPFAYSPAGPSPIYSPQQSHYAQSPSSAYSQFSSPQSQYSAHAPPVPTRQYTQSSHYAPPQYQSAPAAQSRQQQYAPQHQRPHSQSNASAHEEQWVSSPNYTTTSHLSMPSPPSETGPPPPAHTIPIRSNTNRHPQQRPLPGPPDPEEESDYFGDTAQDDESLSQEDLYNQVEDAILNAGRGSIGHSPSISVSRVPTMPINGTRLQRNGSGNAVNGRLSTGVQPRGGNESYSDESDAEAAQGLAMMRAAEEEDARRMSTTDQSRYSGLSAQDPHIAGSDSDDFRTFDVSTFGGGYDVQMTYGGDPNQLAGLGVNGDAYSQHVSSQHSSMRRSHASQSSRGEYEYDNIHPFRPFDAPVRVDAGGTGGFTEPSALGRRASYDEGDEELLMDGQLPERFPDEPPDISFNAASTSFSSGRPLPALPSEASTPGLQTDFQRSTSQSPNPAAPDAYPMYNAQGQLVPRSTSLLSHSHTPQVPQPLRSKTDAEERKLKQQQNRTSYEAASATGVLPDLPSIGAKRFMPSKLGAPDYRKCDEPWALSSLLKWLFTVVSPEQYTELKEAEVSEAFVNLFTNKVPTMNIADAEGLASQVVSELYHAEALVTTEEWVKLNPVPMTGVIYQLTGSGCYSGTLHDHIVPGRCYSHLCQRTLKKVNLSGQARGAAEWDKFYNLEKKDWEDKDKKEIERQHVLHEIVYTEDDFIEQLSVLQTIYRDPLQKLEPPIISPRRKTKFMADVFGRVDAVKQANLDHLLPQLKYRQQEQGPWVVGFSDVFRQWIRKAKNAYLEYAAAYPWAVSTMKTEINRNIEFREFMARASKDPRSKRLDYNTYLKAPITRLQRYSLLLSTVLKHMKVESEEKRNLQTALDEVKSVTHECDARVADVTRKVDLIELNMKLKLRPGMQDAVELNLDHFGRELIHRGDLQRMGGNRFTWLDSHALLFDHYLVIAKIVSQTTESGGKVELYDVSRLPIPMDLLILESTGEAAVQRSSYVRGITTVNTVSGRAVPADQAALSRTATNNSPAPGGLQHATTNQSSTSLQPVTSIDAKDSDKIMYPFRVKHLGRDSYTLFAPTESARRDWVNKIIEAKTKHAAALYAQHAEPFRLRIMADSAFVLEQFALPHRGAPLTKGTPVDRAIKEVEKRYKDTGRPGPVCRARVNCATTFTMPDDPAKQMVAVGTDFGVFTCEMDNPRGWVKGVAASNVTQVAVLEEFNLFLLVTDKSLVAYHLDVVCPNERNGPLGNNDSSRKAPQKLSGSKDVGFFVQGRMKDRTLVIYKKRENLASVFKVLEPVYQKSSEKKRGIFKRGTTEFFREYDEFYIPAECTGINLFHSSLAVSTARGFEVLTLDKKQPFTVPDLRADHVQNIASHIKDQNTLCMLRLSDQEFLLCYTNCAVYVNKHGDISRSVIMDFVGRAQAAALYGAYLILFDNDFVEIRNASNGRLKQIIAGREVKMLDDGGSWSSAVSSPGHNQQQQLQNGGSTGGTGPKTVKFVMQHPEQDKTQLVVELLLNENMKE